MTNSRLFRLLVSGLVICLISAGCLSETVTTRIADSAWVADMEWLNEVSPVYYGTISSSDSEVSSPVTHVTIYFEQETVSGQDGCNRYRADYQISGNQIAVTHYETITKLICSPRLEPRFELFRAALSKATKLKRSEDKLLLLDNKGSILFKFNEIKGILAGTKWVVKSLGSQPVLENATAFISFHVDGKMWGNTGCNTFNFTYVEEGNNLLLSEGSIYEMGCTGPAGISKQESRMWKSLQKVSAYEVVGDVLLLKDSDGAVILESFGNKKTE